MMNVLRKFNPNPLRAAGVFALAVSLGGCAGSGDDVGGSSARDIEAAFADGYLDSGEFYLADQGMPTELAEFKDSVFESNKGEMRVAEDPVFVDIDLDGDQDAAAILEWTSADGSDGWRGLYGWLWDDGKVEPSPWPLSWQWNCAELSDYELSGLSVEDRPTAPGDGDFQKTLKVNRSIGNYCADEFDSNILSTNYSVWIANGVPVTTQTYRPGAPAACWRSPNTIEEPAPDFVDTKPGSEALLYPEDGSPAVQDLDEAAIRVWEPELSKSDEIKVHHGYVPALAVWPNDEWVCSWVRAEDVAS